MCDVVDKKIRKMLKNKNEYNKERSRKTKKKKRLMIVANVLYEAVGRSPLIVRLWVKQKLTLGW